MNYFTDDELRCKGSRMLKLAYGFRDKLNQLRFAWGRPLSINSCCRSTAYNKSVGGAPKSFHLFDAANGVDGTCAADISTVGWSGADRHKFAQLAMGMGWSIGVAKTFLHVDRRADYPKSGYDKPILFTY